MKARYDAVADFYEASFASSTDPVVPAALEILGPIAGWKVLDVACGHGRVTRELARRGAFVTGLDLSRMLLDKAEAAESLEPLGIRYLHDNAASAVNFGDTVFDAVVCNFGLSDIDDLDGVLRTARQVLRPNGVFVFSILHPCFSGGAAVSGAWPSRGRYYDEAYWVADGEASLLRGQVGANHRMLSTYMNALSLHGLYVTAMTEPEPPADWEATKHKDVVHLPVFLVVRCVKLEP